MRECERTETENDWKRASIHFFIQRFLHVMKWEGKKTANQKKRVAINSRQVVGQRDIIENARKNEKCAHGKSFIICEFRSDRAETNWKWRKPTTENCEKQQMNVYSTSNRHAFRNVVCVYEWVLAYEYAYVYCISKSAREINLKVKNGKKQDAKTAKKMRADYIPWCELSDQRSCGFFSSLEYDQFS